MQEIKDMNIYEKMSAIVNELGTVAKNLNVDLGKGKNYKAVQEKDVLDAIKPLEEKYRIYSYPKERKVIDNSVLEKETSYGITKSLYMRIETTYEFVNIDKPEEKMTMVSYGDGIDTGDKAPGKAMTYSDKYSLLKAYKVATGDDPDKDASPNEGYKKVDKKEEKKETKLVGSQRIALLNRINELELELDIPHEKTLEVYKVNSSNQMTDSQLQDCVNKMEQLKENK